MGGCSGLRKATVSASPRAQGQFTAIDEGRVPKQFSHVSRDHWHNYPSGWNDQNGHNGNRGNRSRSS